MDVKELRIGEGDCSIQYEGEGAPVNVGYCRGAIVTLGTESKEVYAGQSNYPIQSFDIKRSMKIQIELVEATLRNLVIAMGGDPADIDTASDPQKRIYELPGGGTTTSKYMQIIYKVPNVYDKTKFDEVVLYRAKADGNVEMKFSNENELTYVLNATAFADPDQDNSPGKISQDLLAE